ncbi:OmpA family protein [Piscinibacter koreensis]|uniref:OmpA family protein n=1 Tax=Piscinibacter koreensis TaxID=2742824 RepID=A0A7Y6TZB7_9BURK|nr:OmpA family protein [Schlegelella koreensis]NUZ08972.1 OmpA family protein [Schlegelella koreensis]
MNKRALRLPLFIAALFLVGSCGAPPKPPEVDESRKRPANTAMAVDLQTCRSDLQNTRILAAEATRRADSASAIAQQLAARQQALATLQMRSTVPQANSVFTVRFGVGSTRVAIPAEMSAALVDDARSAPLVMIRGRTDGNADSPAESHVARARANAVRDYLVGAGVDAARVRTTYQPVGDHAADNTGAAGRAMNRRVEIEVYRAAPVVVGVAAVTPALAAPALP